MKLNIIYKQLILLFALVIFAIQTNGQILCNLGNQDDFHKTSSIREYSGLSYHTQENIFFMPLDAPINIANKLRHFVGYDQNGNVFYPTISNLSALADNDLEGLTYLENNYFIVVEEDKNDVYFLEYNVGNKEFEILSVHDTEINLGSTNDGLEGVSYDPHTKLLFLVREHQQTELFSIPLVLPGAGFGGAINVLEKKSVILPSTVFADNDSNTDNDASGLFHLGKITDSASQLSNNLLILSEGLKKVVEFEVTFNAGNNLSISYINEYPLSLENQPEGITVHNGKLYVASEVDKDNPVNNPATLSSYTLTNNILSCKIIDANCNCLDQPGCMENAACNFDPTATEEDGSCFYAQPNFDCNENCLLVEDCEGTCGGQATPGKPCNDNNANTIDDKYDSNCNCAGDIPGCMDSTACNYQPAATIENYTCTYPQSNFDCNENCLVAEDCEGTCGGASIPGTSCNSENPNYTYNDDCLCVETCEADIVHAGLLSSGIFKVSNSIESTANVNLNQNVTYDAGAYIHLDKGFLADSGDGVFLLAKIEGCVQLREGNFIEQIASIKNYPNPFFGETTIEFKLNEASKTSLIVTDIKGKVVATLADNKSMEVGVHQLKFNGKYLTQGVYYCTLIANDQVSTQKMMLMK